MVVEKHPVQIAILMAGYTAGEKKFAISVPGFIFVFYASGKSRTFFEIYSARDFYRCFY